MQITARNTNSLQRPIYDALIKDGIPVDTRNGPAIKYPEPVLIQLTHPWERVNFCAVRDANPFFHLMEAAAILGNVDNVEFLAHFAAQMLEYSDDGRTQNAFYGTRLFSKWGNQIDQIIENLKGNPHSRQEVSLIWDPADLVKDTKDKACNLLIIFSVNGEGAVEMTTVNRSNDAIWGFVNGANVVHFSFIHEYVACSLCRGMGSWWHFTNNLHVYLNNKKWDKLRKATPVDPYWDDAIYRDKAVPLFDGERETKAEFDIQLRAFLDVAIGAWRLRTQSIYFKTSGLPFITDLCGMFNAHQMYKAWKDAPSSLKFADIQRHLRLHVKSAEWRIAANAWLWRRMAPEPDRSYGNPSHKAELAHLSLETGE